VNFEVVEAAQEHGLGFDPEAFSKGGNATCPFCGAVADIDFVKDEGCKKRIGQQMMAIICTRPGKQGKVYLPVDDYNDYFPDDQLISKRIKELCKRTELTVPSEECVKTGGNQMAIRHYGMFNFGDLFTPRQMLCLLNFAAAVREAYQLISSSPQAYSPSHAMTMGTYLGVMVDKLSDFSSTMCVWNYTGGRGVKNSFGRQALPMTWDFSEGSPFNKAGASWTAIIDDTPAAIEMMTMNTGYAIVSRGSATALPWPNASFDAVITDPPYYDNVFYSNISDFFYVWLKRSIGHLYPEHFATDGTPKKSEAVADAIRYGGSMEKAKAAYEQMMAKSFAEANRVLKPAGQLTVVYAHKTTLGWSTLVDALRQAGFTVTEAWPLNTEMKSRLVAMDSAALASSIFLITRKREGAATGSYEDEVRPELEKIVRERVATLWQMGVGGADLLIAAVGAGLKAFTRFARVEYANGEEVPAEKFLAEVEGVVLETLLERIFGVSRSGVAGVDGHSRFYVLWRYTYKTAEMDAGEAIVFTYTQHVELDGPQGLSSGIRGLVEKKKGKYSLKDFAERGDHEKLGLPGADGAPAPLIDILHRVIYLMENHPRKLTEFLEEARPDRERLRLLAQVLGGVGLAGGNGEKTEHQVTTTPAEKAALGKLLGNWRHLIEQNLSEKDHKTGQYRIHF
jgi:putative DNA methylase